MAVIGNLVANLVADTSKFTGPMQQAEAQVNKTAASVRAASGSVTGGIGAVVGGVGAALSGIAVAGLAAAAGLAGAMSVTIAARKQVAKLEAVVASTGMAAGFTAAEIIDFADSLELVNDVNADVTTSAAAVLATFTQIKGDVFKEALVSAQDLSAVMGQDMQSSIVQIGKALNDPITGLTALRRVGVSFTEQQREQITQMVKSGDVMGAQKAILEELKTEFGGAAKAMSNPFVILYNVAGRAIEGIGALVLPTLQSMATMITTVVAPAATDLLLKFETIGDGIRDSLVPPMAAAIAIITNLGTFLEYVAASATLAFTQMGNTVAYFFTDVVGGYLEWFRDNWLNLWMDEWQVVATVFKNIGDNIGANMVAIWDYIASGGTTALEFAWTPLLDGFKSTVSELPKIADRVPTAVEDALGAMVSDLEGKLQADMATTMEGLQAEVEKKPITPRIKPPPGAETDTAAKDKGAAALQMGSKEAISSIFASMRGADKQDEMLRIQQQQLGIQQQQLDAIEGMAADDGLEID